VKEIKKEDLSNETKLLEERVEKPFEDTETLKKELSELKDKYLRLYAEFENYKKIVAKDRDEIVKYFNETLIKELLPVIDHLELAIQHSYNNEASKALREGVEMTLKEMKNTLEKFGLSEISALGVPFDPFIHHAMAHVESEETEENTVVTEFRKGYMLKDRVLRAALVGVSKKKVNSDSERRNKNYE